MIADGVILKTAAIASQIYFRFLVVDNTTEQLDLENIGNLVYPLEFCS